MSDRRSFSAIPTEVLRDHGDDETIERIWGRLRDEVGPPRVRRPARILPAALGLAAAAFVCGVLVGSRGRSPLSEDPTIQIADFGAEPTGRLAPAAEAPAGRPPVADVRRVTPRVPAGQRGRGVRAVPREESLPLPVPEALPAAPSGPAEWQRLADDGDYQGALAALEAAGGFDAPLASASADELMSLVDVARATGQRARAILVLRRIVSAHGADPSASVAAWMLGNELAKEGDRTGAEQAFALYRALSPGGDFAEDALARQVDFALEESNVEHARQLAIQYLKEFPDGPRRAEFQAQVDAWGAQLAPSAPEDRGTGDGVREDRQVVGAGAVDGGAAR